MPLDHRSTDASAFSKSIYAVVVGVGHYVQPPAGDKLKDLPECTSGAKRLAAVLTDRSACRVPEHQVRVLTTIAETTKEAIVGALRSVAQTASPGGSLFLYFGGHGLDADDSFYLATVNTLPVPTSHTSISAQDLAEALVGTAARGILIVVDCCGGAALAERAPLVFSLLGDAFEYRILLSASKRGQSSWELPNEGSPFTNLLIEVLSGNLPTIGEHGEIYFHDLSTFLVTEMEKLFSGRLAGLEKQEPKAEISSGLDPLVFVNSDISLESVRLNLARFSIRDLRRRLVGSIMAVVGLVIAVSVGVWTWLDQHRFADLKASSVELVAGYPSWYLFRFPDLIWEFDLRNRDIEAQSLLGRSQPLVMFKEDDPVAVIADNLTELGRARIALQIGQDSKATEIARLILSSPIGLSKDVAYDAKDIVIAAAPYGDGASIIDLTNDDKLVTTAALQRIAVIEPTLFETILSSASMADIGRFDREFVFPFVPAKCTGPISTYVGYLLGSEWSFDRYTADLVARTRCIPNALKHDVDWKHITDTQAYLRRLLSSPQRGQDLVAGFDKLVEEMMAGSSSEGFDRPVLLRNALDAAVAFDDPAFKCDQSLVDLVRTLSDQPDGLDLGGVASVTAYLAKYCGRQGLTVRPSWEGQLQIDLGQAELVTVPLQVLDTKAIQSLVSISPATMVPLVTYQIAGDFRSVHKLDAIFALPDLPTSVNLLEGAAAVQDEDVQAAALLWILQNRRADLMPFVRRVGPALLSTAIVRTSVAARSDQALFADLESYALNAPSVELRTCWTTMWGSLEAAVEKLLDPALGIRRQALGCVSFRDDLSALKDRIVSAKGPFGADVTARIDKAAIEHDRLVADIAATPEPLKKWRAEIDFTESLGGKLLLAALVPDRDLRLH